MKFKFLNKNKIEKNIDNFLDNIYKKFRVQYLYLFFLSIVSIITIYHIVVFIISLWFYSYFWLLILSIITCYIWYLISEKKHIIINSYIKNKVENYWIFYFIFWVIILFFTVLFTYSKPDFINYFLYSLIIFLIFYIILRIFWFKYDYKLITNDIKSEDTMLFYTIFIYLFLFFFSYFTSLWYIKISKEILILLGFLLFSFLYIFIFTLYSKNHDISKKVDLKYFNISYQKWFWVVLWIFLVSFLWWFYYDNKVDYQDPNSDLNQLIQDPFRKPLDNLIIINENDSKYSTWIIKNEDKNVSDKIVKLKISKLYKFPRYLWIGDRGDDVLDLQKILLSEWYYKWKLDWNYTKELWDNLKKFITDKIWIEWKYTQLWPKTMEKFKNIEITVN